MQKKVKIVIGANFGDEGKGLMTDFLCARSSNPIVVRFNGGAQAGHTVVTPTLRHVFSHFGAGTLQGIPTYFTEEFILNPIKFLQEYDVLVGKGITPVAITHHLCKITTPWDMMYNQKTETDKKTKAHGSCGMGIHATQVRDRKIPFNFSILDSMKILRGENVLEAYLKKIQRFYYSQTKDEEFLADDIREVFMGDLRRFPTLISCKPFYSLTEYDTYIFEGAQGLLLDRNNIKFFPHLTDSNTGLKNPNQNLIDFDWKDGIEVYYITRCYMTRHGNGPFPFEDPELMFPETTNVTNQYQGRFRFGHLDTDLLKETIENDLKNTKFKCDPNLVITHCDVLNGNMKIVEEVGKALPSAKIWLSFGPTRDSIVSYG